MAKTRAKNSKSFAKLNKHFVAGRKRSLVKKKSSEVPKQQPKMKNTLTATKLQSEIEKKRKSDLQATQDLLKLCRPFSICLSRIKEMPSGKSKSYVFVCIFFI